MGRDLGMAVFSRSQTPHGQYNHYIRSCPPRRLALTNNMKSQRNRTTIKQYSWPLKSVYYATFFDGIVYCQRPSHIQHFMAGAVETNKPSTLSAIDVLLVNCCVLYNHGERGLLSYLRAIGMGRRIGYGFRVSPPLNGVLFLPLLALCCRCDP